MAEPVLKQRDFTQALADSTRIERWSVVGETPIVAIEPDGSEAPPLAGPVADALAQLPCVTVACVGDSGSGQPHRAPSGLAGRVDVCVADAAELDLVASTVRANPLAAVALVQLLRRTAAMEVGHAVVAESAVYSMLQGGPEFARWLAGRTPKARERSGEPAVRLDRQGDRIELRLNRPERRNAYSAEMRDALCEALHLVLRDASLRHVSLRGEGPAFSSGGDLDEFGTLPDPATAHGIRTTRNAGLLLTRCAERVHAHVHGACIGAGVELPAFCHRVTARADAFFALPEVSMGLVPGAGGTASLPRRIGRQRTAWLALTGERIDAPTALAWGLVDDIEADGVARR